MSETPSATGSLGDLLPAAAVAAKVDAADWREAVRASGDLLVSTGTATDAYTDQMLAALDRYGPYIVISKGFALAHAQASDDVLRTGMSFVSLAEPVEFGHKKNDPVRIVAGLASKDHSAHMTALQQLSVFIASPETMKQLQEASSTEELLSMLGLEPDDDQAADAADNNPTT